MIKLQTNSNLFFLKFKIISFVICNLLIGILFTVSCFAEDINFEVTVDRTNVSLGKSLRLNLVFEGTQDISAPELPTIDGFEWHYLGPSTSMSVVNNRVFRSTIHMYRLISLKVGVFAIPPFSIQYDGKTYTSKPITIKVVQDQARQPQASQGGTYEGNIEGLEDRIFLIIQTDKKKTYINEIIPLTIKLYVNRLAIRDIQYPELRHEGFSVDKFAEPKQYQEILNGVPFDVIEFNTDIFGLRPGELILGPAQLQCNLIVKKKSRKHSSFDDDFFDSDFFSNIFGGQEKHLLSLKSVHIPITILDLPKDNVPDGYSGALGNFRFYLEAEPREVKVGDPITLKMTVVGEGNFKTVNSADFNFKDNFKIYDPEIKQSQTNKVFEHVIIPKNDNISEIPEISFSFFNIKSGEYEKITKGPIPIKVNPLPKGEELKIFEIPEDGMGLARKREILGRDIIYIKDSPGEFRRRGKFLYKSRSLVVILFIPLVVLIFVSILQRRKEKIKTDVRYARRLQAPRKAKKNLHLVRRLLNSKDTGRFFDAVFKTLREYLGDKFHLPSAGITSSIVEEELKPRNINKVILDKIKECFNSCDTARYTSSSITREQMLRTFKLLGEIIDKLEKIKV